VHVGAGNNIIYVNPVNDAVAVVRWIDTNQSVNGFVETLLAAAITPEAQRPAVRQELSMF